MGIRFQSYPLTGLAAIFLHQTVTSFAVKIKRVSESGLSNITAWWSVLYGVFDSFTDRPYGNPFLFISYLKPFAIKLSV